MLPPDITITPTSDESDFAACAAIMVRTDPWVTLQMDYEYCLKAFPGAFREVFLIKKDGELIGFVIMQNQGTFKGYIQTICIDEQHRGGGYGSKLLRFCEEYILKFSPNIFICVSSFNQGALRLYQRFGFELIGELKDFIKPGFTELLLRKTYGSISDYKPLNNKSV